jgi:hypothetical protein
MWPCRHETLRHRRDTFQTSWGSRIRSQTDPTVTCSASALMGAVSCSSRRPSSGASSGTTTGGPKIPSRAIGGVKLGHRDDEVLDRGAHLSTAGCPFRTHNRHLTSGSKTRPESTAPGRRPRRFLNTQGSELAVSGQPSWPPLGTGMAASGQIAAAADTEPGDVLQSASFVPAMPGAEARFGRLHSVSASRHSGQSHATTR